jgi:phosphomannomutase/phosphoglucomutase
VPITDLFTDMDGRFPNHHPDPTVEENLTQLRDTVLSQGAEVGVAYDGDADRLGIIDDRGTVLWGDRLLTLFARDILRTHAGASFIAEVKCSQTFFDDIAGRGGHPILWKTGHSLIKKKMQETGALLAGEMSGHLFFADRYFGYDDAIYASLRLLEIVAAADRPLSELLADLPTTYATPELRVDCADEVKSRVVDAVSSHFRPRERVIDVDGARIVFEGGWGLVRASNTQPVLVMRFEADTSARLAKIRATVEAVVQAALAREAGTR